VILLHISFFLIGEQSHLRYFTKAGHYLQEERFNFLVMTISACPVVWLVLYTVAT